MFYIGAGGDLSSSVEHALLVCLSRTRRDNQHPYGAGRPVKIPPQNARALATPPAPLLVITASRLPFPNGYSPTSKPALSGVVKLERRSNLGSPPGAMFVVDCPAPPEPLRGGSGAFA